MHLAICNHKIGILKNLNVLMKLTLPHSYYLKWKTELQFQLHFHTDPGYVQILNLVIYESRKIFLKFSNEEDSIYSIINSSLVIFYHFNRIMTRGGIYCEILPEPEGNFDGGAQRMF